MAAVGLALSLLLVPLATGLPSTEAPSPFPTFGTWAETAKLTPNDAGEPGWNDNPSHWGVHFGSSVAIDGDTLVVGTQWSRYSDSAWSKSDEGFDWAYVFERGPEGGWSQTAKLLPDEVQPEDTFAYSVAVDEEAGVIVAGNPAAETIHIFERSADGEWGQTASFTRSCPDGLIDCFGSDDIQDVGFGDAVAVSGHTVAAGIHEMFVFEKVGGEWSQTAAIPGGIRVALEGDTLVTSIWHAETDSTEMAVYERSAGAWSEVARLDPSGPYNNTNTNPGPVDLSQDETTIIMGSVVDRRLYGVDMESRGAGFFAHGSAWIYERIDGQWRQTADIPNPDPSLDHELFGSSVSVEGGTAVIGADGDVQNGGRKAGAAYVYEETGDDWVLISKLRSHDTSVGLDGDWLGWSVDVSNRTVVVGAPFDDNRGDGSPWPLDDDGDLPPCVHRDLVWGCGDGTHAGSVYVFQPLEDSLSA